MLVYRRSFSLIAAGVAAVAGSACPVPATAQEPSLTPQAAEIARLRPLIGANESVKILPAAISKLSVGFPVKVFLSTGPDPAVRDHFTQWVGEWEKKDAKKYGAVELVASASQADVILVRYALKEKATQKTVNKPLPSTVKTYDNRIWPSGYGSYGAASSFPLGRRPVIVTVAPTYAYVVERTPDGFQLLTRDEAVLPVVEEQNTGQPLWETFKELLKQRAEAAKNERNKTTQ